MWERGALAIGWSHFLRKRGVLLNTFSKRCGDLAKSFRGGVVFVGAAVSIGGLVASRRSCITN